MKKKNKISKYDVWEVKNSDLEKSSDRDSEIIKILLENRGIEDKKEFFSPNSPLNITLKEVEMDKDQISKSVKRIIKAIDLKERIIIYGDYDADGITATAILWEALYKLNSNVLPYIPNRFEEGYGINYDSFLNLKEKYPDVSLLITVDNGIVAVEDCEKIQGDGVDVIISDHHQKSEGVPDVHSIVHTDKITGAAVSWMLVREVYKGLDEDMDQLQKSLDLAAIGTIADIASLIGPNRSFAYHGIKELNKLERTGLAGLAKASGVTPGQIAAYTVGFILAPRLNAMGRLESAMDSLRLLCSKNRRRIDELASKLDITNKKRQRIVDEVVEHAFEKLTVTDSTNSIVVAHDSYHEGVIGLAASKLVEEHFLPSIVVSKGKVLSKASARSISGFNIIESIRKLGNLIEGGGGHPMAAGFTIKTENIEKFAQEFEKIAKKQLTQEIRQKVLKIDTSLDFSDLSHELAKELYKFHPLGPGNPAPSFLTEKVEIKSMRPVGKNEDHLKLVLSQEDVFIDAIGFGFGKLKNFINPGDTVDVVYNLEENKWNGNVSLQAKIKDIRHHVKRN